MVRILVLGSGGFVGGHMLSYFSSLSKHTVVATRSKDLNLLDQEAVANFFESQERFDFIIHCCAVGGTRLKADPAGALEDNLRMTDNILTHRDQYGTLVHFSSGAARAAKDTAYGFAKHLLDALVRCESNAYNFRIYGCFGPNEPEQRFITSCLRRKMAGESMVVHQNKQMDFLFIDDLVELVRMVVDGDSTVPRELDAVYTDKVTLLDIAEIIGGDVKVNEEGMGKPYVGQGGLERVLSTVVGLKEGIARFTAFFDRDVRSKTE